MGCQIAKKLTSEQIIEIKQNQIFLQKEKSITVQATSDLVSHLRILQHFGFQGKQFLLHDKSDRMKYMSKFQNIIQANYNYWNILTQLLEGIFQMHQLGFIGRCISYETLYVNSDTLIFCQFGYFHEFKNAPENIFKKFTTFETDLWLVGAILWKIITKQDLITNKSLTIKMSFNFQNNDQNLDSELYVVLKQILQIYQTQRIPFTQLLIHKKLQFQEEFKQQMLNFYENYQIEHLLKIWKYSLYRDFQNGKLFFYQIKVETIKYYYKCYVQIQLLNFAFHLSFLFPNNDENVLLYINSLIIQKMYLLSKELKFQVLTFQVSEHHSQFNTDLGIGFFCHQNYQNLRKEILSQHNKLLILKQSQANNIQIDCQHDINVEINKFDHKGQLTLPQKLLINILNNSSVKQLSHIQFTALSLVEIFEHEIYSRLF
ncbi:unnamed protein product [Paramecium sonneborni]|uniref:Protein kinase domain-containing protein n=1 Tax=Paramecium sonneborni TaxID=65129 RepID=A0A8S1L7E4_9CILI|nr:unnamed protein product [Paramecium sonneborni]